MKTLIILPFLILSFVALAESAYDKDFYASDFMNEVSEVKVDVKVPVKEEAERAVAQKKLPKIQKVLLNDGSLINGEWEVVRVLDKDLKPVYDKRENADDKKSEVLVNLNLIKTSTVRINKNVDQTYSISLFNKKGTIVLFKQFEDGYEVLEARKVVKEVATNIDQKKDNRTKIEKRFESNQELILVSAQHPTKSKEVLTGNKVSGSIYLMGDQVSFDGLALVTGNNDVEALSFQADINGDTGHLNYNNEIQGLVSVIGKKEIKVRFSTGPLAGAMLSFMLSSENVDKEDVVQADNYAQEDKAPETTENNEETLEKRYESESRDVASQQENVDSSNFDEVSADF